MNGGPSAGIAVADRVVLARFVSLWQRCSMPGADGSVAPTVFGELLALYTSPTRRYHTPAHLEHVLSRFDLCRELLDAADEVELALWFHDAVYDAQACDNERRSAELYAERARGCMTAERIARVFRLIMVTTHRESPGTNDERFIIDIDLSGFGLPWDEFHRDSLAVRAEYTQIDDVAFLRQHLQFLRKLASRERFFYTDFFHQRLGRQARANITRTLRQMAEADFN